MALSSQATGLKLVLTLTSVLTALRFTDALYHKKYLPLLDHKNIVNFTGGYDAKDAAYGAPAGKVKTIDGSMVDRFRVRYMAEMAPI
jgi:hypothetical protein